MDEDMVQQEYYCSFDASIKGAYFADEVRAMREQGRICKLPVDPNIPIDTYWDLGAGKKDAMSCWFGQTINQRINLIDYEEHIGEGWAFWSTLLGKKKYSYGTHYAPHDATHPQHGAKVQTILEIAEEFGIYFDVIPRVKDKQVSIQAARKVFPSVYIDEDLVYALDALSQYTKKYDEVRKVFSSQPEHNWACHCADAFQQMALVRKEQTDYTTDQEPYDTYAGGRLS